MAINFNKTWEQRSQEAKENTNGGSIADGSYKAKINNAAIIMHPIHKCEVIDIDMEVISEGSEKGKTTTKTLFIDENYKNVKKRKWDEAVLVELLDSQGLKFNDNRELLMALYDLRNTVVNLKISRSKTLGTNGKPYVNREISPLNNDNNITKESTQKSEQPKTTLDDLGFDELID
ncbi:hypothetical protein NXS15_01285 [Mycoplasma sp. CSL7475-4]|uniref:hypothetical protein n=1 Tax=Mycoplasma sp. CSL7475-4 TaxID=2973942 RepID=UPI00216B51D5|nr:hypothetical protein [Mycoplasma sp. CSL7475-4]MCS4536764.1 hypothetical protein [Mycoplasma sp. CSL7475-4]